MKRAGRRRNFMRINMKKTGKNLLVLLALLPGIILIIFPMYVTIVTAFKTPQESGSSFFALPSSFFLGNFISVINKSYYFRYILNTAVILLCSVIVELLIVPMAAYSIQRNNRKYYRFIYIFIVCGLFVPFQVRMVSLVQMMSQLHLMSKLGMVFLYLAATTPPGVFLITGYLKSVPEQIEEAAYMDGSSYGATYFKVVFPLLKPILSTLLIKDSLFIWNDFQLPLIILNGSTKSWTLQLFQYNFKSQYSFDYNLAFASFIMTMLPILILYILIQKNIVAGLSAGAVKG
jgi:hypothetical protein